MDSNPDYDRFLDAQPIEWAAKKMAQGTTFVFLRAMTGGKWVFAGYNLETSVYKKDAEVRVATTVDEIPDSKLLVELYFDARDYE